MEMKTVRVSTECYESIIKIALKEGAKSGKPVPVSRVLNAIITKHVRENGVKTFMVEIDSL
jgi:hypothetical protein